jgi:hypothetical protein
MLPGIAELSSGGFDAEKLGSSLIEEFANSTGWRVEPAGWTAEEEQIITDILPRFTSSAWNQRR